MRGPAGRLHRRWHAQPAAAVAGPRGLIGCGKSSEVAVQGCALRELAAAQGGWSHTTGSATEIRKQMTSDVGAAGPGLA